jgi:hypothetical protein
MAHEEMSQAMRFAEEDMTFSDIASTPAQQIVMATIVFEDGSYLICSERGIQICTEAGVIPLKRDL